ncbi:hypothetical protein ACFWNJ_40295, partial [Streptomyces sp. NPDC058398]
PSRPAPAARRGRRQPPDRDAQRRPQRSKTSAIRQLVLQAPAPVIAKALGYHDKTATRLVTEADGTWSRYAPGGHTR